MLRDLITTLIAATLATSLTLWTVDRDNWITFEKRWAPAIDLFKTYERPWRWPNERQFLPRLVELRAA